MFGIVTGGSGLRSSITTAARCVYRDRQFCAWLSGGATIDGTKSRDPGNTGDLTVLRAGLLMGKVTSGGKYAPSILGTLASASLTGATTLVSTAATVTELVRRIGATGTFKITGPTTANGTVRTLTATYSATSSDSITVTALGVNEVQTVNLSTAGTGGTLRLLVPKPDGTIALTPAATWSATDATLLSNLNTALDTATGVSGGIVATAIAATDTDLGVVLTFSGTGYAGLSGPTNAPTGPWPLAQVHTLFTSNTGSNVVRTTTGVSGAFVAGSFIGPTDGSETPITMIDDAFGIQLYDRDLTVLDQPFVPPIGGMIDSSQLLPSWPSDTSLRAWIVASMNAAGKFVFDHSY